MKSFKDYLKEISTTFDKTAIQDARNILMVFVRNQNRSKKTIQKFSDFMLSMSNAKGEFPEKIQKGIEESGIKKKMAKEIFMKSKKQIQNAKLANSRKNDLLDLINAILMDIDI